MVEEEPLKHIFNGEGNALHLFGLGIQQLDAIGIAVIDLHCIGGAVGQSAKRLGVQEVPFGIDNQVPVLEGVVSAQVNPVVGVADIASEFEIPERSEFLGPRTGLDQIDGGTCNGSH